jgi:glycosyltransferase involved in cell wall biosynthesis
VERPVLFLSHDLNRAGAQLFLLQLLRWLAARGQPRFELLSAGPGDADPRAPAYALRAEFERLSPVHWLDAEGRPTNLAAIRAGAYSLIYANTCTLGPLLASLGELDTPVLCHVHEMGHFLAAELGRERFEVLARTVKRWVACSDAVREALMAQPGIERVDVVPPCVELPPARPREEVRARLKVPPEGFLVVCCGTLEWRKGCDLIVPMVQALRATGMEFHLVWFGASPGRTEAARVMHELNVARAHVEVRMVGVVPDVAGWFGAGDAFALLSREDPFPLVMIEAAAAGLPVVGFAGSGGVEAFTADGSGFTVPFLDLGAMSAKLAELARDKALRTQVATRAIERGRAFRPDRVLPALAEIIEQVMQ